MSRTFEPGIYKARITNWGLKKARSGNMQFVVSILPEKYFSGGEEHDCPALERTIYRVVTENTIEYVVKDLDRLGYDRDTFDELEPSHPDAFDFRDKEIQVRMEEEEYEGKVQERWSFVWGGALDLQPAERQDLSKLNAIFGPKLARLRAAQDQNAPQVPAAPASATSTVNGQQQRAASGGRQKTGSARPGQQPAGRDEVPF